MYVEYRSIGEDESEGGLCMRKSIIRHIWWGRGVQSKAQLNIFRAPHHFCKPNSCMDYVHVCVFLHFSKQSQSLRLLSLWPLFQEFNIADPPHPAPFAPVHVPARSYLQDLFNGAHGS